MSFTTPVEGAVENLDVVRDKLVGNQAISTTLSNGRLVYLDGANGYKVVPTTGIEAGRIRFAYGIPVGGQTSNATLGNKKVQTVKSGAIVIGKCDGAITVGQRCRSSTTGGKEGQFLAIADPTEPGAAYGEAAADSLYHYVRQGVAIFLGKASGAGGQTTNTDPTDGADGDLGRFLML